MNPMNKTRTLSFRLAEDDYQKLVERCRVSELSQSKYLRYLIRIPELFEVVGFGADDAPRGFKGVPFVNRYEHDGDYSWNGNNYIDADTCRIAPRE